MRKSKRPAVKPDSLDIEFPDWSGMDSASTRLSVRAAFELCEQYSKWFPQASRQRLERRDEKCLVEFVL